MQVRGTGRYKALDRDGIAAVGEVVSSGEILINKQSPTTTKDVPSEHGAPTYKPMPVSWKAPLGETCIVDKVLLTQNDDAHIVIKVISLAAQPISSTCYVINPFLAVSASAVSQLAFLAWGFHLQAHAGVMKGGPSKICAVDKTLLTDNSDAHLVMKVPC